MTQKLISMTEKEISRHTVIKNLIDGKINGTDASKQICLSIRQVKRLKAKIIKLGIMGLVYKNHRRGSNRKLDPEIVEKKRKTS